MSVSVKIPTQLREATGGEGVANVDGETVGEALDALYERYGELRSRIPSRISSSLTASIEPPLRRASSSA